MLTVASKAFHARLEKEAIEAEIQINSCSNTTEVAFTPTYKVNNGSEIRKTDPIGRTEHVSKGWNLVGQGQAWQAEWFVFQSFGVY